MKLDPQAQALLDAIEIDLGGHTRTFDAEAKEKKLCIMETTAYIAGLPVSESPVCSSGLIIDFMIGLNDSRESYDDPTAELVKLKEIVPELIGTCPTKKGKVYDYILRKEIPATVRNETKGYLAAEDRRDRRLWKEVAAYLDEDGDLEYDKISTEDGIRIARILAGIKNKV